MTKVIIDTELHEIVGKEVGRVTSVVLLSLLLASLMIISLDIRVAKASTVIVPSNYPTIQEAINHANEGDTILVRAGTYNENIVVNKTLHLRADYREAIIHGDNVSSTVIVEADNVTLVGFKITNEIGTLVGIHLKSCSNVKIVGNLIDMGLGEGILVEGGAENSIVNNWIEPCTYHGIELVGTSGNFIMGNWMDAHGNAIRMIGSSFNHIVRNDYLGVHFFPREVLYLSRSNSNVIEENQLGCIITYVNVAYFWNAHDNTFFHNSFLPALRGVAVSGNCSNIHWDNGLEGNYWWNYTGVDLNGDGIGDTPYIIDSNFTDQYPLMEDYSWWNPCDINGDYIVNIFDIVLLCSHYTATPADSDWNFLYDIAEPYGRIDIYDLVKMATNYGKECPP